MDTPSPSWAANDADAATLEMEPDLDEEKLLQSSGSIGEGGRRRPRGSVTSPTRGQASDDSGGAAWQPAAGRVRPDTARNFRLLGYFVLLGLGVTALIFTLSHTNGTPPPGSSESVVGKSAFLATGTLEACSADNHLCSELGLEILAREGSKAADAAVAVAVCQGILSPYASGIGGGAFAMHFEESTGIVSAIDGRETAPAMADPAIYSSDPTASVWGGRAVGVPGELALLDTLFREHGSGKWSWQELFEKAIHLGNGATVGPMLARRLREEQKEVLESPTLSAIFAKRNNGSDATVKEEGDPLQNDKLLQTLALIAEKGPSVFYNGSLAKSLVADIERARGIITLADLRSYKALPRKPLLSFYDGRAVYGFPPPSAGGASLAMALNILEGFQLRKIGRNANSFHLVVEALKFVFGQRRDLADPAFEEGMDDIVNRMLDKEEAMLTRSKINATQSFGPGHYADKLVAPPREAGTTHVSIVDKFGNSVALTSSVNLPFGSKLVSESTGVVLNNQMDDFSTGSVPNSYGLYPAEANEIKPGKRPLSSMSPTLILHNNKLYLSIGASGGPRIISAVLQAILNVIDFGDDLAAAIAAPRLHHQLLPNDLELESINNETCAITETFRNPATEGAGWPYWSVVCSSLKGFGHSIETGGELGCVQATKQMFTAGGPDTPGLKRTITAASDPRKLGLAAAL